MDYHEFKLDKVRQILSNPYYFGKDTDIKVNEWSEDELISYVLYVFIDDNKKYLGD